MEHTFIYMFNNFQEEMANQQPQYEQFIQLGLSILEKCDPESNDAEHINSQMDTINHSWDKLEGKLGEREANLKEALCLGTKYYEVLQSLTDWITDMSDKVDGLSPVSTQPETIEQQKKQLQVMFPTIQVLCLSVLLAAIN